MWDFHSHILPKVDDGAQDMEETITMAMMATQEGIDTIVATPHFIPHENEIHKDKLMEDIERITTILKQEQIPLKILPGMEVFGDWDILDAIDEGKIATINNTKYLLMELPMQEIPDYIEDLIFEIQVRGLVPIIAHPERNRAIQQDPNILGKWIENGLLAQLNTGSLEGILGQGAQETAKVLLEHNMVHILGSDAHTSRGRSPRMKKARAYIEKNLHPKKAKLILETYPMLLLADETITPLPPREVEKKKKRKFWFFGK